MNTHSLDTKEKEYENIKDFLTSKGIEKPTEKQISVALHSKTDAYLDALKVEKIA